MSRQAEAWRLRPRIVIQTLALGALCLSCSTHTIVSKGAESWTVESARKAVEGLPRLVTLPGGSVTVTCRDRSARVAVDTLFNVVQHWFTLSPDGGTFRSAQYRLWSLPKLFDNADTKTQPAKSTDVMFCELEGDTFLALRLPHPTGVGHVDEWRFPNGRASPRGPEPLWYLIFKREKQQSFRVQDVTKVEIQSNPFTLQGAHAAFTLSVQAGDREVFSLPTLQPKLGLWPSEKEMQLAKIFSKLERFGHALFFLKEQGADQKQSDPN